MSTAKGTKVLVVDDERIIALTTRAILDTNGYQTEIAFDGEEAVQVARRFRPEFLLTDVVMPRRNGIDAAIEIRKFLPNCKVLLFSGNATTTDLLEEAHSHGMRFDVLAKPVHPTDLLGRVSEIIAHVGKPSILVVDDDEAQRYATAKLLAHAGYEVIEAGTGEQALKMSTGKPALVLLDVRLPDMHGLEVLKRLKDNELTRDVPIVQLTAYPNERDRDNALRIGAAGYLARPIRPEELLSKLMSAVAPSSEDMDG
ncbi:MAG TPA: response regulator [Clostridia bacterium]|nr:response regulator [Clostridia bacterium]